jgi:hypothetical protein
LKNVRTCYFSVSFKQCNQVSFRFWVITWLNLLFAGEVAFNSFKNLQWKNDLSMNSWWRDSSLTLFLSRILHVCETISQDFMWISSYYDTVCTLFTPWVKGFGCLFTK